MMMGPEPMIRMRWMSSRRGITSPPWHVTQASWPAFGPVAVSSPFVAALLRLPHELGEIFKKVVRVVRPGRSLRMILHTENRIIPMPEAFESLIVQIDVSD